MRNFRFSENFSWVARKPFIGDNRQMWKYCSWKSFLTNVASLVAASKSERLKVLKFQRIPRSIFLSSRLSNEIAQQFFVLFYDLNEINQKKEFHASSNFIVGFCLTKKNHPCVNIYPHSGANFIVSVGRNRCQVEIQSDFKEPCRWENSIHRFTTFEAFILIRKILHSYTLNEIDIWERFIWKRRR